MTTRTINDKEKMLNNEKNQAIQEYVKGLTSIEATDYSLEKLKTIFHLSEKRLWAREDIK